MIFRRSAKDGADEQPDGATPDTIAPTDHTGVDDPDAQDAPERDAHGPEQGDPEQDGGESSDGDHADPPAETTADDDATTVLEGTGSTAPPSESAEPAAEPPVEAAEGATPDQPDASTAVLPESETETAERAAVAPELTIEPEEQPVKRRRRGRRVLIGVGVALVLLGGGYAAAAWYLGDKVPQGTSVAGVDLSGMTAEAAETELQTQLADLVVEPIPIEMGSVSTTLDPAAAGLTLDVPGTIRSFTGFTWDPSVVMGHLFGLGAREPVVVVDEEALTAALEGAASDLDLAPVDAAMDLHDGEVTVTTEPADGLALEVAEARELIADEWLTGQRPFELPSTVTTPTLGEDAVQAATDDIATPLLSGPVTVQLTDDDATELSVEQLTDAATLQADGSRFALVLDGEQLAEVVTEAVPSIGETPKDAQIVLEGGEPTIIPAVTGTGLDPEQLAAVVSEAALSTDERVAAAELAQTEPEFSTADAEELGVVEVVGEYATPYPYDPTRTQNLVNGAANINGTLVMPGEEFSLIAELGPITAANGYVSSGVVENGFATQAMGGGLSQISTTTFNAAFEAGMEDIEHKPHSRWFQRYPPGREATIYVPTLDMRWGNNTPYGVLVQAWVSSSDGNVHVRLWSTDYWDVDIASSERYGFTSPQTVYNDDPECTPESGGASGFTIDVNRTIARDGTVNEEYSRGYSWTYSPWNNVVCGERPSPDDDDDDESSDGG